MLTLLTCMASKGFVWIWYLVDKHRDFGNISFEAICSLECLLQFPLITICFLKV
jgi:hypothetical protein